MLNEGKSSSEIARELGRNRSSIYREIMRNCKKKTPYSAAAAQTNYANRRKRSRRTCRLSDPTVLSLVTAKLNEYWSPEQIDNRLKKEGHPIQIGMATIYRGFSSGLLSAPLRKKLRRKGRKPKSFRGCGHLPVTHTIHERPDAADKRERLGDWEGDTIRGAKWSGCVATLVDRKSRYSIFAKLPDRTAAVFTAAVAEAFKNVPPEKLHTITCDHGKEFAEHQKLADILRCTVYFADPGNPGQRGTNENTNGLLRQFLPKRTSFASVSQSDVDAFAEILNRRPRKCLGWMSPHEVFFDVLLHLT
jgi:IS30 family transposase